VVSALHVARTDQGWRIPPPLIDFTAVPNTFMDGGHHVVVLGRYGGTAKDGGATLDSPWSRGALTRERGREYIR
jgi:hypothetical protein